MPLIDNLKGLHKDNNRHSSKHLDGSLAGCISPRPLRRRYRSSLWMTTCTPILGEIVEGYFVQRSFFQVESGWNLESVDAFIFCFIYGFVSEKIRVGEKMRLWGLDGYRTCRLLYSLILRRQMT